MNSLIADAASPRLNTYCDMNGDILERSLSVAMSATVASQGMIPCCDIQSFMAVPLNPPNLLQYPHTKRTTSVLLSLHRNPMDHCLLTSLFCRLMYHLQMEYRCTNFFHLLDILLNQAKDPTTQQKTSLGLMAEEYRTHNKPSVNCSFKITPVTGMLDLTGRFPQKTFSTSYEPTRLCHLYRFPSHSTHLKRKRV